MAMFPASYLYARFHIRPRRRPAIKINVPTKGIVWQYNGHGVMANTKSEARAIFNRECGKLPPGAIVTRVDIPNQLAA